MSGWAGLERIALSTAGVLTAAFGVAVLLGGTSSVPVLRDIHQAWPSVSPALALWLLVSGIALVALGSSPEALGSWTRDLRLSQPRQTLVLALAALATVLATCVAVAHGDRERDQRHERQLAIAENDMIHATVGPIDRLTDVASTVQGPMSVRRSQFDALASRLLDQRALTSVALARSAGGGASVRSRRRRGPRAPPALHDRLLELARQGQPDARGGRAVGRPLRAAGRDPLRRDARHRDPARGRRLAAEHRRRRARPRRRLRRPPARS